MYRSLTTALAAATFAFGAIAHAADLRLATQGTQLEGQLIGDFVMTGGEMRAAFVLWLDAPVTLQGNPAATEERDRSDLPSVERILIVPAADGLDLRSRMGTPVRATGTLHNRPDPHHHTTVTMRVTALEALD
jgi:hypothetical protein